jgi:hypothetical protein
MLDLKKEKWYDILYNRNKGSDKMIKEISIEAIDNFNELMEMSITVIRLRKRKYTNIIDIVLSHNNLMESYIINPDEKFYIILTNYFLEKHDLKLSFNNTRSCFWSI